MPLVGMVVTLVTLVGISCYAETSNAAPNNLPAPYREVENWAQLPPGVQWGHVINVVPDAHGNIWVFHRIYPAILEFDSSGK